MLMCRKTHITHSLTWRFFRAFEVDLQKGLKASTFFSEHEHMKIPKIVFHDHHFKEFIS